jgi:hypothetical protein
MDGVYQCADRGVRQAHGRSVADGGPDGCAGGLASANRPLGRGFDDDA